MNYTDINAKTIDSWIEGGWEWGIPISHEEYTEAQKGNWNMLLTPVKPVPKNWYPDLRGKKVLGLASGGGQQMPIFAALGAECYVLDYSSKQIASEEMVAAREHYEIHVVRADMTKRLPYEDNFFDLIFHPVSNCYIEDVQHVWEECFRILKPGGRLMAGLDNGMNFLCEEDESKIVNTLPFNPLKNPEQMKILEETDGGVQFSHTIEEQIAGQLKAGFCLLDVYEDTNGRGYLHEHGVPAFWATLAQKKGYKNNIFLIGFMGAGKSTIARTLQTQYGMNLVEMDEQIEAEESMKISDIFAQKGEAYFRSLETQLLESLRNQNNTVVSCGGGVPMRECNVEAMRKSGNIVYLSASPETIYERIRHFHTRPLLEGNMNVEYISQLMDVRLPKYLAAADVVIETDGKSAEEISEEIMKASQGLPGQSAQ